MSVVSLTSAMNSNLLSLTQTSSRLAEIQHRLATGLKINSAIDNPSSYYSAVNLSSRASDLSSLLDSMGQGVQTVKAAAEALETGLAFLEQAKAIANQALTEAVSSTTNEIQLPEVVSLKDNSEELRAAGYTAITADMTQNEVQALLSQGNAKLYLAEDITFENLYLIGENTILDGAGHKLTLTKGEFILARKNQITNMEINASVHADESYAKISNVAITGNGGTAAFRVTSWGDVQLDNVSITQNKGTTAIDIEHDIDVSLNNVSIDILGSKDDMQIGIYTQSCNASGVVSLNNVKIRANSDYAVGVLQGVDFHGKNQTSTIKGITKSGNKSEKFPLPDSWFSGKKNTQAVLNQIGAAGLAASASNQFYVGSKNDANFGQGNWYLPSIDELMQAFGGDCDKITDASGKSGLTGNKSLVEQTLSTLSKKGVSTNGLGYEAYWSSTEAEDGKVWALTHDKQRVAGEKDLDASIRPFLYLENKFTPTSSKAAPKIGDVIYSDLSYGSADDLDKNKTAVGVVTWVSEDGKSAKLMNLRTLTFNSSDKENNFDPDNPYGGSKYLIDWATTNDDIKAIENCSGEKMTVAFRMRNGFSIEDVNGEPPKKLEAGVWQKQYDAILRQYDMLIKDAGYKGVNLLQKQSLQVRFNENRSSYLLIEGQDASSAGLGLHAAVWETRKMIENSLNELSKAVNKIRSLSGELGNNYSIVQVRQDFTESLINILTEGADKLTLADMNEESAVLLALQTRQQLAVNSLSLASQAAQSVLRLFA